MNKILPRRRIHRERYEDKQDVKRYNTRDNTMLRIAIYLVSNPEGDLRNAIIYGAGFGSGQQWTKFTRIIERMKDYGWVNRRRMGKNWDVYEITEEGKALVSEALSISENNPLSKLDAFKDLKIKKEPAYLP
jgi:predicted transcriptional regulator